VPVHLVEEVAAVLGFARDVALPVVPAVGVGDGRPLPYAHPAGVVPAQAVEGAGGPAAVRAFAPARAPPGGRDRAAAPGLPAAARRPPSKAPAAHGHHKRGYVPGKAETRCDLFDEVDGQVMTLGA